MPEQVKLHKKHLAVFNRDLKECDDILEDLNRAEQAGVPNVEHIKNACQTCKDRILKLKATYFPESQ